MRKRGMFLLGLLTVAEPAAAQFARAYANLPRSSSVIQLTSSNTASNTSIDDAIGSSDLRSRSNAWNGTYVYTVSGFNERAAGIGVVLPYVNLLSFDATTNVVTQNQNGLGDLSFTFDHNFYGAKSMSRDEFMRTAPSNYGGLHAVVSVPTGPYDSARATNIGSNRYALKLTYNQSFTWDEGKYWLDFYGSGRWFTDNDEYLGDKTLSQDPIVGFEAHLSRDLGPRVWVEAGVIWTGGGKSYLDGVNVGRSQDNWKAVLGGSAKTWRGGSFILTYSETIQHQEGTPRGRTWMILMMHVL